MTVRCFGATGSCNAGMAAARLFTTISIGSSMVCCLLSSSTTFAGGCGCGSAISTSVLGSGIGVSSFVSICVTSATGFGVGSLDSRSWVGVRSFTVLSFVISASGVPGVIVALDGASDAPSDAWSGSGDTEGSGVSNWDVSSTGASATEARGFLPRFFGTVFEGEGFLALSGAGVKVCVGSIDSVTRVRRLVVGLGVASSFCAAAFRGLPRPLPTLSVQVPG